MDELGESRPWWKEYFKKLPKKYTESGTWKDLGDAAIVCKLAACDVVADLTDHEAIRMAHSLTEAEATAGMEDLDRILATFPNQGQVKIKKERLDKAHADLKSIFSFVEF